MVLGSMTLAFAWEFGMDDSPDDANNNVDDEQFDELEKRRQDKANGRSRLGSKPRRLTDPARSGSGQIPPRGRSTAVGGAFDGRYGLKAGENVWCVIREAEPGGYAVWVKHGVSPLTGYLPTQQRLRKGEEVLATYVCVHKERVLLTARFGGSSYSNGMPASLVVPEDAKESPINAFKRAADIMPVSTDPLSIKRYDVGDHALLETLPAEISANRFTGVLKMQSDNLLQRAAMLFYRGRILGCTHTSKTECESEPTPQSIAKACNLLKAFDVAVEEYALTDEVALPFSALFIGYPVVRADRHTAKEYFDYISSWFKEKKKTACLVITLPPRHYVLAFINSGILGRSFCVEQQRYIDVSEMLEVFDDDLNVKIEASILPPEMTLSAKVRFGYRFSL